MCAAAAGLTACEPPADSVLAQARERGVLRVATVDGPTTYYQGPTGPTGFEHDLAGAYARDAGLKVEFIVRANTAAALKALDEGEADVAAAGLTASYKRTRTRRFSPPYQSVRERLVCGRGVDAPLRPLELSQVEVVVEAGSNYAESLALLAARGAPVRWREAEPALHWEDIVALVSAGDVDCTVLHDHVLALHKRYTPNLVEGLELPDSRVLAWALAGGASYRSLDLAGDLEAWFRRRETRELLDELREKYYGFAPSQTGHADAAHFRRQVARTLPKYEELFRREGERAGVPWTLLAAISYQESHWNPRAKSPTGVRGMMMLTRPTAAELGVDNRLDPDQSVRGGARYLRRLFDRLPDTITEADRWWFAAAAYNLGLEHVRAARRLAEEHGFDPDRWADVREMLAYLEKPELYGALPEGSARGRAAQIYVRRVRDYADVLEKRFAAPIPETPTGRPEDVQAAMNVLRR
ncbi:MAG: membrane-bound lytic murein transglycosylase MltF [Caulobacterales bacterium]|nr:membrane-bound lytic murein transglycosylase MltF [Caulobacterales bacterium]